MGYNPNQPRDPEGVPTGGQWTAEGINAAGRAAREAAGLYPFAYDLNKTEKEAIHIYVKGGYAEINDVLRKKTDLINKKVSSDLPEYEDPFAEILGTKDLPSDTLLTPAVEGNIKDVVLNLDRAIKKNVIPEDMLLYRGITNETLFNEVMKDNIKRGDILMDLGYCSTSSKLQVGKKFLMKGDSSYPYPVLFEITTTSGQTGFVVNKFAEFMSEAEILLPRGSEFVVTGFYFEEIDEFKVPVIKMNYK